MMWERVHTLVEQQGGKVVLEAPVTRIRWVDGAALSVVVHCIGEQVEHEASHILSSMPLGSLVAAMDPSPPPDVLHAARALGHRDFLSIALVVPKDRSFPD